MGGTKTTKSEEKRGSVREREGKFRANQIWRGRGDEMVGTSRNMLANMLMQSVGR